MLSDRGMGGWTVYRVPVLILVVMEDALWLPLTKENSTCLNVLILVVMEDALWRKLTVQSVTERLVLILVVMEDALWQCPCPLCRWGYWGLNPCCNGRCSLTVSWVRVFWKRRVLILVVMEDALWPSCRIRNHLDDKVLILVVMEDALWQNVSISRETLIDSLNPCCNGRCSLTIIPPELRGVTEGS